MLTKQPKWDTAADHRFTEINSANIDACVGESINILRSIEAPADTQGDIEDWIQDLETQVNILTNREPNPQGEPNVAWWVGWWMGFATYAEPVEELTTLEKAGECFSPKLEMDGYVNEHLKYNAEMVYQVRGGGFQEFPEFDVHKGITETLIGLLFMLGGLARNYKPGYHH